MLFRKDRPPAPPSVPIIHWIIIGVVMMAALANLTGAGPDNLSDTVKDTAGDIKEAAPIIFENYKQKIFPASGRTLSVNDLAAGDGNPALCGQEVSIAYDAYLENGKPVGDKASKEHPLAFRLGEGKAMPALEQGVLGMRRGGKRSLLASANMAYGLKRFARADAPAEGTFRFEIELLKLSPALPDFADTSFRIADLRPGVGNMTRCGESARLNVTIWNVEGKKLYSSRDKGQKPVTFIVGKSEVFMGLEQGALGLREGGARTLIVPPAFQKTITGQPPAIDFPLPMDQTVLVDIELVP